MENFFYVIYGYICLFSGDCMVGEFLGVIWLRNWIFFFLIINLKLVGVVRYWVNKFRLF